jgi:hypothetical protein
MKRSTVLIILGVLGGLLLLGGAIVAFVFYATSGVTSAADKFFATARGGDVEAVYALTSGQLRSVTTPDQLGAFLKINRFNQVAETSWNSRSFENNIGNVTGTVRLDDGSVVPVSMQLAKEGEEWKISYIDVTQAGLNGGAGR